MAIEARRKHYGYKNKKQEKESENATRTDQKKTDEKDQTPEQTKERKGERDALEEKSGQYAVGLALSGGGIRSATFSLGVLVALARRNLLHQFDYLWPAPGSEDTELGVLMEPEVDHGETEVYAGVQA
jgi:hypothetical protein